MSFNYTPDAQYPAADALAVLLRRNGMLNDPTTPEDLLQDFSAAVGSAMQEFENVTGWRPFLAGQQDTTRYFNEARMVGGSGGYGVDTGFYNFGFNNFQGGQWDVDLQGGLLSCSAVQIGTTSYSLAAPNPQAYFLPDNALARNRPFETLRFCVPPVGATGANQIAITGRWGFCQNLPPDVWNAVLGYAAREVAPGIAIARTGEAASYTLIDIKVQQKQDLYEKAMAQWLYQFNKAASRPMYKRWRIS